MIKRASWSIAGAVLLAGSPLAVSAGPVTYAAAGGSAAAVQGMVDAFRADLGALNPNTAGSAGGGRREINWDGVPDAHSAPNPLPANFFNANSPRGVEFATPGSGFQVSANAAAGTIEFGNINPLYPSLFAPFSMQRLFTALDSNVVDVRFLVPGSATAALTNAFGAVFTDVDLADTTAIQYFDAAGDSLGTFFAPAAVGDQTLSFVGVRFTEGAVISRVRITSGNQALSAAAPTGDVVVMDDFIYGEPVVPAQLPEPSTLALVAAAVSAAALRRRAQR